MSRYQCSLCQLETLENDLNFCVCCRAAVCAKCTLACYPNRKSVGLCVRCTPPDYGFACGRCRRHISYGDIEFFCDMCAVPICFTCVASGTSFECGQLKCSLCCECPMSQAPRNLVVRHEVDDAMLRQLPIPLGVVYKCHTEENEVVVVKEMVFNDTDVTAFEAQARQVERMRQLNHPHLIRYLDVSVQKDPLRICVVMPFYSEGDLKKFIERQRKPVTEVKLCSIVLQIAGALNYLHRQEPPLVHRDIKPENILLLNHEEQVLLMDLDLCRTVDVTASVIKRRELSPTYEYRAPELEKSHGDTKADVFSLGVVMFVLATLPDFPCVRTDSGEMLVFSASKWSPSSLKRAIQREIRRVQRYTYSEEFIRLVVAMLVHQPAARPTSGAVIYRLQKIMEQRLMEGKE
ncbi:Protein kinase domain family protein [Leishmania donovani]|uniref:Protein kinase domain family protein n=1 Tax=Leishmania donovani TaxID=5661 RepID=A0A504XXA2_LEIDO|nr:Protein kinase domain family protein [Leishmania donovani]TPP52882.1 Protein kinase domain family protein [Leishmania donovani]